MKINKMALKKTIMEVGIFFGSSIAISIVVFLLIKFFPIGAIILPVGLLAAIFYVVYKNNAKN